MGLVISSLIALGIRYVVKDGELLEAATLDQLGPVGKPLPKPFWWDDVPTPEMTGNGGSP